MPLHDVAAFRQGDRSAGLVDGGTVFVQSPLDGPVGDLGVDPGRRARPRSLARGIRSAALDTAGLARRHAPRARTSSMRMQGVALVGVFLRLTPFAERAGIDRDAAPRGGPRRGSSASSASAAAASSTPTSR